MYDINGEMILLVRKGKLESEKIDLNVANFLEGIYFLKVKLGDMQLVKKVVIL